MDIDQLLAKHPAPWEWWDDQPFTWFDANGGRVGTHVAYQILFNAYAELKAENAKYRAAIGHADWMLECEIDGPDFDDARANYDAARKELP